MPVIRRANSETMIKDAIVLDLGDLREQANALMSRAKTEADRVLAKARTEATQLVAEASAKGHLEGFAKGEAEGLARGNEKGRAQAFEQVRSQSEALEASWTESLERWEADRGRMLLDAREDVLALALAVAEKVVYRAIELDPSCVIDQVQAALTLVARRSSARVLVNPADRAVVNAAWPTIVSKLTEGQHVQLVDDPTVDPGGCRVTTEAGSIDATIDGQIERIVETLLPDKDRLKPQAEFGGD